MTTGQHAKPISAIPPVSSTELAEAALPGSPMDPRSHQLLESELEDLRQRRLAHDLPPPTAANLTGLALSGGGIRSATFALGVLQALAKYDLLKHFDYLSTVSGGGYIGSSLSWWWSKASGPKRELKQELTAKGYHEPAPSFGVGPDDFPYGTDNPSVWRGQPGTLVGPRLLCNLRKHGNYLTPGAGITAVSGVSVLLRAVIVNLVVWLPLITVAMLGLLAVSDGSMRAVQALYHQTSDQSALPDAVAVGSPAPVEGAQNPGVTDAADLPPPEPKPGAPLFSAATLKLLLLDGLLLASVFTAIAVVYELAKGRLERTDGSAAPTWARQVERLVETPQRRVWLPAILLLLLIVLLVAPPDAKAWAGLWLFLLAAGILATTFLILCLVYGISTGLRDWLGRYCAKFLRRLGYRMRRLFETWARLYLSIVAGLTLIGALPWIAQSTVAARASGAAGLGLPEAGEGVLTLVAGLIAAGVAFWRSGQPVIKSLRERGFKVSGSFTGIVAAAFLLLGVLLITHDLATRIYQPGIDWLAAMADGAWTAPGAWVIGFVVALAAAVLSGVLINVNHISVGRFYRDRLMEAFMPGYGEAYRGATGAAPSAADEMTLLEMSSSAPYHIINTNVVLVNAKDRRRCMRGGDSFILTPKYSGSNATGWCRTDRFMNGQMTLATAMAISGAAANPNTGVGGVGLTRSRVVSVLMALLNLRLGYWVPHPGPGQHGAEGKPQKNQDAVPNDFYPGLSAIFRGHHEEYGFQELTDGGHFENLGVYELIRRRVSLILVCDGGQDPDFGFEDLQTALRRVGEDFGAKIEFVPQSLEGVMARPVQDRYPRGLKLAERGFAVGCIHYPPDFDDGGTLKPADQRTESTLIYLNTTMIDGLPLELLGYTGKNPDFPDQSTRDQFFDEDQFEAYRELGYRIAEAMIDKLDLRMLLTKLQPPIDDAARAAPLAVNEQHPGIAAE